MKVFLKPLLQLALQLLGATLLACTATPDRHTSDAKEPPARSPFQLEEAYLADNHLLIQYRASDTHYHTRANLHLSPVQYRQVFLERESPIRELIALDTSDWRSLASSAEALEILTPQHWNRLLEQSFTTITPTECVCGVAVDIFQHQELFSYYNNEGSLVSVSIDDKPRGYRIADTIGYKELLKIAGEQLRTVLDDTETAGTQVIFETGNTGFPFAFASEQQQSILLLEHPSETPGHLSSSPVTSATKTFTHSVTGHIESFVKHPISSLRRLLALVTTSATDMIRPTLVSALDDQPIPPVANRAGMDLDKWEGQLDQLTGQKSATGKIRFLVDGHEFFSRLTELASDAEKSVYMRMYIFDNDDYAIRFADFLKRRAESVDVRVILDGLGTIGAGSAQSPSQPESHDPPFSVKHYLTHDSKINLKILSNPWLTGDHTKSIIIDEKVAFVGGMNIGREYRYDWHDLMIEVEGPVVTELLNDFKRTWVSDSLLGGLRALFLDEHPVQQETDNGYYPVRVLYTKPGSSQILRAQIKAIRRAQREILLENAYLTSDAIIYELVKARRRGVDVRVIIPYETDSGLITRSNAIAANTMLENGIRVYIYPGMSHVKAASYDGWACFGSANFDNLSLRINKELNLSTSSPEAVNALKERIFYPDMDQSIELTEPLPHNWFDHLAELLADSL